MKFKNLIVILALVVIALSLFDEVMTPTTTNQPDSSRHSKPQAVSNVYALRAADNTWPTLEDTQVDLSDDLSRKNYYLVFDGSGSMEDSRCSSGKQKIRVAKTAVIEFLAKIPRDANIGMLAFDNSGAYERVVLGQNSSARAVNAVQNVRTGGGTPLDSAIRLGYRALTEQAKRQLGYGEYHLVVITDGEASSGQDPSSIVDKIASSSPIVLHTIGFCISGDHSLNQAGITLYKSANNPAELARGLDSVLAEASDFSVDAFEAQ